MLPPRHCGLSNLTTPPKAWRKYAQLKPGEGQRNQRIDNSEG